MTDLIVIALVVLVVGLALRYIIKAKKRGVKCIGCPESCASGKNGSCSCSCGGIHGG